jgi:hypothetical protein
VSANIVFKQFYRDISYLLSGSVESIQHKPGVVGHPCNPRLQEAGAGRLSVQGQPGLHSETLSQTLFLNDIKIIIVITEFSATP